MKKIFSLFLSLIIAVSAFSIADFSAFASDTVKVSIKVEVNYDNAAKMIQMINKARKKRGLRPVKADKTLTNAAIQRAAECAMRMGHEHKRPNGTSFRTSSSKVKHENVWAGYTSDYSEWKVKEAFDSLMESPAHKANTLRKDSVSVGVACIICENQTIYTQEYGTSKGSGEKRKGKESKKIKFSVSKSNLKLICKKDLYYTDLNKVYFDGDREKTRVKTFGYHSESSLKDWYTNNHAFPPPLSYKLFNYSSSNKKIFTVNKKGVITVKKPGKATLTVTLKGNKNVKFKKKIKFIRNDFDY